MDFVELRSFDNYIEANIVLNMLQHNHINCHLKDENIITIDPLLSPALGGMKLMVFHAHVPRAWDLMEDAEKAVEGELERMRTEKVTANELQKVKNKVESLIAFEDLSLTNRANSLAFYELLGDADQMNHELEKYNVVTAEDILIESQKIFRAENSNTLYYYSKN